MIVLLIAAAVSGFTTADSAARTAGPPVVECTVPDDPGSRVFRLEQAGEHWQLSFKSRETGGRWIRLTLPSAQPVVDGQQVRLSYRNANGGRQIDLSVTDAGSSLDVWVDYGLEVNIEPDLDPKVDLMNTEGSLEGVRCLAVGR